MLGDVSELVMVCTVYVGGYVPIFLPSLVLVPHTTLIVPLCLDLLPSLYTVRKEMKCIREIKILQK